MPIVKLIGRPSIDFYGKYLSEIARNLKYRGTGRVVIKETEANSFKEPSFYVIKNVEPLMSDTSGVRCRANAERVYRGHNFGITRIENSHEPDWRLISVEEGKQMIEEAQKKLNVAPSVHVKCVAPMPPVMAIKLQRLGKIPQEVIEASRTVKPAIPTEAAREGNGFLLLTKLEDDPLAFQVPIEPTGAEKSRVFPDYAQQTSKITNSGSGLVRKKQIRSDRDVFYIRRGDTPGIRWRVDLAERNIEDRLLETPSISAQPPPPPPSSPCSTERVDNQK